MYKYIKFLTVAAFTVSVALMLSSCNDDNDKEFTVTFDLNYTGSPAAPPAVTVVEGKTVARPTPDPTRADWTFNGWFTAATGGTPWDFDTPITANRPLFAQWTAVPIYTVEFDSKGGSAVSSQNVKEGDKVTEPPDPTKDGYVFGGWYWYWDEEFISPWIFDTREVTADITLAAKWVADVIAQETISATIENASQFPTVAKVRLMAMNINTNLWETLEEADFTGGGFTINLPETVDERYLRKASAVWSEDVVNNPNALILNEVRFVGINSSNVEIAEFKPTNKDNDNPVDLLYADDDVNVFGIIWGYENPIGEYSLVLKNGWNFAGNYPYTNIEVSNLEWIGYVID